LAIFFKKENKMKAAILNGIRKLEINDIPEPQIKNSTDVLLEIRYVGVCGSDIHYYTGGKIGNQVVQYPFVIGHECSAIVQEVGAKVTKVKPGDKVAVDPAIVCGKCHQCLMGRVNTCLNLKFLGCPGQMEGCLSEYIVMPQENCYPTPQGMSLIQAALVEPFSIGLYAVKLLQDFPARKIGILGAGPIGLSVLLAAQNAGVKSIYITDKIDFRLVTAKKYGAIWGGNPEKIDIVNEIHCQEPFGLDAIFECCGDQAALNQAIDLLRPGGRLFILGIPEENRVSFDINQLRRKEICIQNVRRQNSCTEKAIKLLANRMVNLDWMVTHCFNLEQTEDAFQVVANYQDQVLKAMIGLTYTTKQ
jgi:L-iditol 2-dehydrogenase